VNPVIRTLSLIGEPVLRVKADEIHPAMGYETELLIADLWKTMNAYAGVGLAANQVGQTMRVAVLSDGEERLELVNPSWEPIGEETQVDQEGCLSIPGLWLPVRRHSKVRIMALDREFEPFAEEVEGLMARIVQHECDHLDGVLMVDRITPDDADYIKRSLASKARRAGQSS
jgi:peptide deformylase